MTNLKEFAEAVKSEIAKRLGEGYELQVLDTLKNNGVSVSQLCIKKQGSQICPSIYLEEFFEKYEEDQDLQKAADNLISYYKLNENPPDFVQELADDWSYGKWKDKIVAKLISTRENQELLKDVPNVPYLDMSIVFCLFLGKGDNLRATAMIRNQQMEEWKITTDELYQNTMANMQKNFPPILYDLDVIMQGLMPENLLHGECPVMLNGDELSRLFLLSNQNELFGATAILYPGVMKQCREKIGKNFIILPSSTEEVLLYPMPECVEEHPDADELSDLLQSVNENCVNMEERLSDHAYRYLAAEDQIICA